MNTQLHSTASSSLTTSVTLPGIVRFLKRDDGARHSVSIKRSYSSNNGPRRHHLVSTRWLALGDTLYQLSGSHLYAAVLTDGRVHNHITTCRLQAAIQCPVAQTVVFPISLALIWGAVFSPLQLSAACFCSLPRFICDIHGRPRYIY